MSRQKTVCGRIILFASVSCLRLPSWLQVILFHEDFRKRSPASCVVIWIWNGRPGSPSYTCGTIALGHWHPQSILISTSHTRKKHKNARINRPTWSQNWFVRCGCHVYNCTSVYTFFANKKKRKENGFQKDRTFFVSLASLFCSFSLGLKLYLACKKGKNLTYFLLC